MAANPLPLPSAQALIGYVFHHLKEPEAARCDHTHRYAREWCERYGASWPAVRAWLNATGGFCDCEVLFNTGRHLEPEGAAQ